MSIDDSLAFDDLRHLRYAQHFSIWALRTAVTCSPNCRVLLREFNRTFAGDLDTGLDAYHAFIQSLGKGYRKVNIGRPGHITLTYDERCLLAMLAAAQDQDRGRFLAHACFFMGHNRLDDLYATASNFTALLSAKGHFFRKPQMTDLQDAAFHASLSAAG